jgi:hypothetical protein
VVSEVNMNNQEVRYIRVAMKIGNTEFTRRLLGRGGNNQIILAITEAHPEIDSIRIIESAGIDEGDTIRFISTIDLT